VTHNKDFNVTPFWQWICLPYLRNGTRYRLSYNGILIGTYTRLSQRCHFEWPWVTFGDLATYSMTQSIARFLCFSLVVPWPQPWLCRWLWILCVTVVTLCRFDHLVYEFPDRFLRCRYRFFRLYVHQVTGQPQICRHLRTYPWRLNTLFLPNRILLW